LASGRQVFLRRLGPNLATASSPIDLRFAPEETVDEHLDLYRFLAVAKIVKSTYLSRPPTAGTKLSAVRTK